MGIDRDQQPSNGLGDQLDFIVDAAADPHDVDQAVARFLLTIIRPSDTNKDVVNPKLARCRERWG